MHWYYFVAFATWRLSTALSIPLNAATLIQPSRNSTTVLPPDNATAIAFGDWPPLPYSQKAMGSRCDIKITALGVYGNPAIEPAVKNALSDMWAVLVGRDPHGPLSPQRIDRDSVRVEFIGPDQPSSIALNRGDAADVIRTVLAMEGNWRLREIARAEIIFDAQVVMLFQLKFRSQLLLAVFERGKA